MLLNSERAEIAEVCRRLLAERLVVGTAGNVSVRSGELVAITPTGVGYERLTADMVPVYRVDGTPVEEPLPPTSELQLHLAVYRSGGSGAVVHTHSPAATALSCLVDEVPAVHYYLGMFGGSVRVAPYAPYGTAKLAAGALTALDGRTACLLGNHGAVTLGTSLAEAYDRAVYLEHVCDIALRVLGSGLPPRLLPPDELERMVDRLARYRSGGR